MAKKSREIAEELRDYLDQNSYDAVTFQPADFYAFVERDTVRSSFETSLSEALNDVQLLYKRGASCFIVLRDYNFAESACLDEVETEGMRSADECVEILKKIMTGNPTNVISIRWKPDFYQFVGRSKWRSSFTDDLEMAARRYEMQYIEGTSCGFFVRDYNFNSMK